MFIDRRDDSRSVQCLRASWKQEQMEEERDLESEGRESQMLFSSSREARKGRGEGRIGKASLV